MNEKKQIEELIAFRGIGETFTYMGITMTVRGHFAMMPIGFKIEAVPLLQCDYVDKNGIIHRHEFHIYELPMLKEQQAAGSTTTKLVLEAMIPALNRLWKSEFEKVIPVVNEALRDCGYMFVVEGTGIRVVERWPEE